MPGFAPYLCVWAPSWLGRGLFRLSSVVTKMWCPFPGITVPLTDGACALAELELTRLCGLDWVQQSAISREPLINSLGTGNCHFDQNIFFSLGCSRKDTWKLLCHNYGRPRNSAVDQKHFSFFFLMKERTATQHHPDSRTLTSLRGQTHMEQRKNFGSCHN